MKKSCVYLVVTCLMVGMLSMTAMADPIDKKSYKERDRDHYYSDSADAVKKETYRDRYENDKDKTYKSGDSIKKVSYTHKKDSKWYDDDYYYRSSRWYDDDYYDDDYYDYDDYRYSRWYDYEYDDYYDDYDIRREINRNRMRDKVKNSNTNSSKNYHCYDGELVEKKLGTKTYTERRDCEHGERREEDGRKRYTTTYVEWCTECDYEDEHDVKTYGNWYHI